MLEAAAPGKLLLSGEYAVLRGAPAVCVSVDVSARVRIESRPRPSLLHDGRSARQFPFQWQPASGLEWLAGDPGEPGSLPAAVWQTLAEHWPAASCAEGLQISLLSDEFSAGERGKFGLGSSAALTVALVGAMIQMLGKTASQDELARLACLAHRRFQSGRGSGADVLTAVFGRLLNVDSRGDLPVAEPLAWPTGLQMVVVWSGQSASTPQMIQAFERLAGQSRAVPLMQQLELAAGRASVAWRGGETGEIMAASQHYAACLQRLDEAGNIGILTAEHRALAGLTDASGAVYKTSGAGGGDLGFALTQDPDVAQRLRGDFAAAGFQVLDRQLAVAGLKVSGQP